MIKKICIASCLAVSAHSFASFDTTPPTTGALDSHQYRNIFSEVGKTPQQINSKVVGTYNKMFAGTDNERLYFTLDNNEAYIKTIDTNDVRSEGMSWGMTIAVMMDKQAEFDKLWRFAHDRMKNTSGSFPGTFAWQVKVNNGNVQRLDNGSAPDGELYMAFALFNAAGRWGNGTGVYDYEKHANDLLATLKNHLMDSGSKQILFSPYTPGFTDPSYHIPAFYDYFAKVSNSNKWYWTASANASRTFLSEHFKQTSYGLASYLAEFDGRPKSSGLPSGMHNPGNIYEADAWRVAMNVGVDAHLAGVETWHKNATDDLLNFFKNTEGFNSDGVCSTGYSQKYHVDGRNYKSCNDENWRHDIGQKATNAVATLASTNANNATAFINELWNTPWMTGDYRYYHGNLHMLGLLHASGRFQLHYPASADINTGAANTTKTVIKTFKDAFVRGGSFANTNYGTTTSLAVKRSGNLTYERRAVMAFDRSRIGNSGNRNIVKATLRFKMKSANSTATTATAGVYGISNRWQETGTNGITYNRMTETGTTAATFNPKSANQWVNVDVTDYLRGDSSTTRTVFMIRNINGDAKSNWEAFSRESANDPELVIEWN